MSAEVTVEKDIVFGQGGGVELMLDVYRPPAAVDKHVAVIQVYGGGFNRGSKDGHVNDRARELAELGYVGVAMTYRLADVAKWPAQVHDTKAAIRWTRANAAYLGIDPDKVCIAGYSAGGQLAMFCAGTPNDPAHEGDGGNPGVSSAVAACVAYYPSRMLHPSDGGPGHAVMAEGSTPAQYSDTDPLNHIRAGFPPTILLCGCNDTGFPPPVPLALFNALRNAGSEVDLHLFAGQPHIFDRYPEFSERCNPLVDLFLDRYVVNPREYPAFVINRTPAAAAAS